MTEKMLRNSLPMGSPSASSIPNAMPGFSVNVHLNTSPMTGIDSPSRIVDLTITFVT